MFKWENVVLEFLAIFHWTLVCGVSIKEFYFNSHGPKKPKLFFFFFSHGHIFLMDTVSHLSLLEKLDLQHPSLFTLVLCYRVGCSTAYTDYSIYCGQQYLREPTAIISVLISCGKFLSNWDEKLWKWMKIFSKGCRSV